MSTGELSWQEGVIQGFWVVQGWLDVGGVFGDSENDKSQLQNLKEDLLKLWILNFFQILVCTWSKSIEIYME